MWLMWPWRMFAEAAFSKSTMINHVTHVTINHLPWDVWSKKNLRAARGSTCNRASMPQFNWWILVGRVYLKPRAATWKRSWFGAHSRRWPFLTHLVCLRNEGEDAMKMKKRRCIEKSSAPRSRLLYDTCTWKRWNTNIPISVAFKDEKSLDERKYALEKSWKHENHGWCSNLDG